MERRARGHIWLHSTGFALLSAEPPYSLSRRSARHCPLAGCQGANGDIRSGGHVAPPAKIPGTLVAQVSSSISKVFQREMRKLFVSGRKSRFVPWLMAGTMVWASITYSDNFFSVNRQKDFSHFFLLFLTIVLSSSGIGGGTGSPEIFFTAPKRGGQASKQVPHFMHFS